MNAEEQEMADEAMKKAKEANSVMNNERLKRIEAIADAADEGKDDLEDYLPTKEPKEEKEPEIEAAEETARALQEEGTTPEAEGDEKDINGVRHYLTVVNGREKWQTLKQLRETASKVEAADEYLHQAKEAVKNTARQALSKDVPVNLEEDEVRKLLAAGVLGDEEAIGKLAKAITARPSVTPDVLQAFDQRMSFRTELASLEAKSQDLLEDPYMGRLFRARLNELKAEAPETKLAEAYQSIDKELRTAFPGRGSKVQEKLERKRTLVQVPSAASRQQTETEDEGEEDPSDVIEKMAKARGYIPHVHGTRRRT